MRQLLLIFLLAIVAGCAVTTAPVVIRELAPPVINTENIKTIAILPSPTNTEEHTVLFSTLKSELAKAIEENGRFTMKTLPGDVAVENPKEIAEAAQAAEADMLIELGELSASTIRRGSTLKATYSLYNGLSGKELLSKTEGVSGIDQDNATKNLAEVISRSLVPHGIERTIYLEYGFKQLTRVGVELAKQGIWNEAERKWWIAARTSENEPAAYHNLGVALERRGLYRLAETAYQNAFARNPKSALYIEDIARINKKLESIQ